MHSGRPKAEPVCPAMTERRLRIMRAASSLRVRFQCATRCAPVLKTERLPLKETIPHPVFYRYGASYPRKNESLRNYCPRAYDERNAALVCV
jgi:hypothetical protein